MRRTVLAQVDRATNGEVRARVLAARAAGESYETIAYSLRADGVIVTGETVRQWVLSFDLGVDKASA